MFNNDRLRRLRKEANLTQNTVAAKLNIRRETYTKYETGHITPPADMIVTLCNLYNVSSDYLLSNSNDPTPPDKEKEPAYEIGSLEWLKHGLISRGFDDLSDEQVKTILFNVDAIAEAFKKYKKE